MPLSEHLEHWQQWWNKADGSNAQGYGIIVCKPCNERLYCGKLPESEDDLREILTRLPNGSDNRTIQEIFLTLPPHVKNINQLGQEDLEEVTANDMPTSEGNFTTPTVVDTTAVDSTPASSNNGEGFVKVMQTDASYTLTAHFSRTISEPGANFGSITCGFTVSETFPGEVSIVDLTDNAKDQYVIIKAMVLEQLGLSFEQGADGLIREAFPNSQKVTSLRSAATEPQESRPASRGTGRTPQRSAPSTGQRGTARGTSRASHPSRSTNVPNQADLWYELTANPGEWFWNQDKRNPREADFLSTMYYKEDGWPVSLWEEGDRGSNLPDDEDWNTAYQDIPESAFAQERPRRRD